MSNKLFYTLVVISVLILSGVGVYAVTAGGTENPGHNIQSIGAPTSCEYGQYLKYGVYGECNDQGDGSSPCWVCDTPSGGGTNYWTDSGSFVEPTSGDKVGATQYCDENGANCVDIQNIYNKYSLGGLDLFVYNTGSSCPTGYSPLRYYYPSPKTCNGNSGGCTGGTSCTTATGWLSINPSSCTYITSYRVGTSCTKGTGTCSQSPSAVVCTLS